MKRKHICSSSAEQEKKEEIEKELQLGYINLSDEFFEQAKANFTVALELDPDCADAFWGLMLAKCQIKNENLLLEKPVLYKNICFLPECENALAKADENLKKIYMELLEKINKINEGENY